jgi:hypothetical protein
MVLPIWSVDFVTLRDAPVGQGGAPSLAPNAEAAIAQ